MQQQRDQNMVMYIVNPNPFLKVNATIAPQIYSLRRGLVFV